MISAGMSATFRAGPGAGLPVEVVEALAVLEEDDELDPPPEFDPPPLRSTFGPHVTADSESAVPLVDVTDEPLASMYFTVQQAPF